MSNHHSRKCKRVSCAPECPPKKPSSDCEIQTCTFANPTRINIPGTGTVGIASPYPSPIIVSGMTGEIIKVTVRLINLSHTSSRNIDIMLVGPGGQSATILSDIGTVPATPVTNVTLTLDDLAPLALNELAPLISGTFKPTNADPVFDAFPGAPPPSGGSMLSSFNFTNPNGTWNLFVVDDNAVDTGSIADGWELTITTSNCTL